MKKDFFEKKSYISRTSIFGSLFVTGGLENVLGTDLGAVVGAFF